MVSERVCREYARAASLEPTESHRVWYFSNMVRTPVRIDFHRTKYGPEILIDVAWIHEMPTFLHDATHSLSFYDITLVTAGRGDC